MSERFSFLPEDAAIVAAELDVVILETLPTRRGSALIVDGAEGKGLLKIANEQIAETELGIAPSRSYGIENEARILNGLSFGRAPGLRRFHRLPEHGLVYSMTEYIDAYPLSHPDLASVNPTGLVQGLVSAVGHLHNEEIIHRDIQPENVLFSKHSSVDVGLESYLIDFELSKHVSESSIGLPGLYHYVSPEVAAALLEREECDFSIAEEVFSVTATSLAILTGQRPVDYGSDSQRTQRLKRIVEGRYSIAGCLPETELMAKALRSILESPVDLRPKTIRELIDIVNPYVDRQSKLDG